MLEADSMERIVPDQVDDGVTGKETLELHMERYRFAIGHLTGSRFLDIACGVGYGSHYLVTNANPGTEGIGVDLEAEAIAYARDRYRNDRLAFQCGDAMEFHDAQGFDTVVSLETIEHVPDPVGLVAHLATLIRPGGTFIASAPVTPSTDANPHHLSDFSPRSFRALFARTGLREVDAFLQIQPYSVVGVLGKTEARTKHLRSNRLGYYLSHPGVFAQRIYSTLRFGFTNRYLTLALRKES
jgi:2-polyprenyl-3-methyl-5-hydroxy-6-metoxy-1,4-benzoquinol methylase